MFLTSESKHPDIQKDLDDYVGGFKNKKMVYIPTAAHSEQGFGIYKTGGTYKNMSSLPGRSMAGSIMSGRFVAAMK